MMLAHTLSRAGRATRACGRTVCISAALLGACERQAHEPPVAEPRAAEAGAVEEVAAAQVEPPRAEVSYPLLLPGSPGPTAARSTGLSCRVLLQPRQEAGTPEGIVFRLAISNDDREAIRVEWPASGLQIQVANEEGWPMLPLSLRGPAGHAAPASKHWSLTWTTNEGRRSAPQFVTVAAGEEVVFRVTVPRVLADPAGFAKAQREQGALGSSGAGAMHFEAIPAGHYTLKVNLLLLSEESGTSSVATFSSGDVDVQLDG